MLPGRIAQSAVERLRNIPARTLRIAELLTMAKTAYLALLVSQLALLVSAVTSTRAMAQTSTARSAAAAPTALSNGAIVKMVKAGLGETIVIAAIEGAANQRFDLTPGGLIALKSAGVPDAIIAAMQRKAGGSRPAAPAPASTSADAAAAAVVRAHEPAMVTVTIPAGTELHIQIAQTIASDQAKLGQVLQFTSTADVTVGGYVVVPRDSVVYGKVTKVTAQRFTRAGNLAFTIDSVEAVGGSEIALRGSHTVAGGRGMVTGNEASVAAGTIFTAVVDHDEILSIPVLAPAVRPHDPLAIASTAPRAESATMAAAVAPATSSREAGIYVDMRGDSQDLVQLEPTVFTQGRTGGMLTSAMTYGIKKMKWKAVVRGQRANLRVRGTRPVFYFYFERNQNYGGAFSGWMASASSPNEFVLAKMDQADGGRELIVGEFGTLGASTGTRSQDTVDFKIEKLSAGVYRVTPVAALEVGREYCLFYAAGASAMGAGGTGKLFDFGVDVK